MLARNLDEEDRDHAEISVERPRECEPTEIEVKFTNYKSPYPYASFDARGGLSEGTLMRLAFALVMGARAARRVRDHSRGPMRQDGLVRAGAEGRPRRAHRGADRQHRQGVRGGEDRAGRTALPARAQGRDQRLLPTGECVPRRPGRSRIPRRVRRRRSRAITRPPIGSRRSTGKASSGNSGDVSWRESEIRSDKTSDSRRSQLRSEVRELDRKRESLREALVVAERELDRLRVAQRR